jgi:uncharacterized protein YdhG (YjbR/CyaY superfamily)
MKNPIHEFYETRREENRAIFLVLRDIILAKDKLITEEWKYGLPFFYYKKKMLLYFWEDKKTKFPYAGFVDGNLIDHPLLDQGNRKRMKALNLDPNKDLPIEEFKVILAQAITIKNGINQNRFFKS